MGTHEAEYVRVVVELMENEVKYDSLVWNPEKKTWEPFLDGKRVVWQPDYLIQMKKAGALE